MIIIIFLAFFLFQNGDCNHQYDPWGVWNKHPVTEKDSIRTFSTGKYHEYPFGVCIVKYCYEAITAGPNFPGFVIPGEYTQIEKYEPIQDGFIFYLVGPGFKYNEKNTEFQDNTRIQLKMHFVNVDECYFEYVSFEDEKGFHLSYFPEEKVVYKRLRAK